MSALLIAQMVLMALAAGFSCLTIAECRATGWHLELARLWRTDPEAARAWKAAPTPAVRVSAWIARRRAAILHRP